MKTSIQGNISEVVQGFYPLDLAGRRVEIEQEILWL